MGGTTHGRVGGTASPRKDCELSASRPSSSCESSSIGRAWRIRPASPRRTSTSSCRPEVVCARSSHATCEERRRLERSRRWQITCYRGVCSACRVVPSAPSPGIRPAPNKSAALPQRHYSPTQGPKQGPALSPSHNADPRCCGRSGDAPEGFRQIGVRLQLHSRGSPFLATCHRNLKKKMETRLDNRSLAHIVEPPIRRRVGTVERARQT